MTTDPTNIEVRPTSVRYYVLAAATTMSVLLYLDRYAVNIPLEYIREALRMNQSQAAWFVSAFFWSYALCQVPAGWLSDRFGARAMLTIYIIVWSIATGMIGWASAVWMLLWLRVVCGVFQAGAYPTAGALIRQWYPLSSRGTASSIVGLGGRFGGVLAPFLTASLIFWFASGGPEPRLTEADFVNENAFVAKFDLERAQNPKDPVDLARRQFVTSFLATLSAADQEPIKANAAKAEARRVAAIQEKEASGSNKKSLFASLMNMFDHRDWVPQAWRIDRNDSLTGSSSEKPDVEGLSELVRLVAAQMPTADFLGFAENPQPSEIKLTGDAESLLKRRSLGSPLSDSDRVRLNRFVLEKLFTQEIRKHRGLGWRQTLIVYGAIGILVTALFLLVVRNSPLQHPWCNAAEQSLINDEATQRQKSLEPENPPFPWRALLTDISLWGNSVTQFLTNVGWLFVATSLPRYLEKVHDVPLVTIGLMTAFPMAAGILGLFCGGRCTDWAVRRFGLKWGRRLPLFGSRFSGALGYAICILLSYSGQTGSDNRLMPWLYVAGLCLAAASTDFGTPAIWAYAQDVGGKYTASVLGWGNMWGNIGAAVAPHIYNAYLGEQPTIANWNAVFGICAGAFALSGFSALLLDATRPLTVERSVKEA